MPESAVPAPYPLQPPGQDRGLDALRDLASRIRLYETLIGAQSDLGDGVVLLEAERFVFVNDAFCRLTGYTRNELTSPEFRLEFLWAPEEAERMAERMARRLAGDVPEEHYEVTIRPLRGPKIHCEVSVKRVNLPERNVRFAVVRDVTERKEAQAELDLARKEMAQSEKLAALGVLVGGVAHEVRTPLVYIQNSLNVLARHLRRETEARRLPAGSMPLVDECLAQASEGVDRINRLVKDLARYSRLSTEPQPARLDGVVGEALDLYQATHVGTGIHLQARLEATPELVMDRGKIQQVVLNLLQNASEAMPRGGRIRIATEAVPGGARLVVQDEGEGMPAHVRERIFDPFYTTKADGMGLGLSIVRRIVELHRGSIRCDSGDGQGTKFTITLPCRSEGAGGDGGAR